MAAPDRDKALDTALAQIERSFGKGSVMRLGEEGRVPVEVIPTGSIALDVALGIGGLPRGRVVEVYGPESSGKTTVALHAVANAQKAGGIAAFIDAEHALDPDYAQKLGVDTDALLVSQPDTGEQALEIADMLIRSGALDIIVIDSVAALVPRAEIEGEMGDSHVGLQARLMSQALRKITGALSTSKTTAIFINQLREKIGVMFGCLSYGTRVTLADGTQEQIGKIVNGRLPVEVLSYDPEQDAIVPKRVVNWFDNGKTDEFLQISVARPGGNGRAQMGLTRNHQVRTPGGWREAGELVVGDRVMLSQPSRLSPQQWQVVLGSLLGDGNLSPSRVPGSLGTRFRMGHGPKQREYLDWKASLFGNIGQSRRTNAKGASFVDLTPLPELAELRQVVYLGGGRKHITWDYLKALTPLALALWYMDDGSFSVRSKGMQQRTSGGSGRIEICVEAMSPGSRERLASYLRDVHALDCRLRAAGSAGKAVLTFTTKGSADFQRIVAPHIHPSMDYKLLPRFRGAFAVQAEFTAPRLSPVPAPITDIHVKPPTRSMRRFDIEVEGSHNYLADGVIVHNSPETTSGGRALKFYASVRLDVRRIETLKDGTDPVGNRTRVKVVKNKVAPPFKQAEFDILFGHGISREGGLIDVGVEQGFVRKSGAWYTYDGDQLGQGKENARAFLRDNPDLADEIEKRIKEKLGVGPRVDAPADAGVVVPVDFWRALMMVHSETVEARAGGVADEDASPDQYSAARSAALRLLTVAPRSRAQLETALARKGIREDVVRAVLDRLTEVALVDDAAFAEAWVRSRSTVGRRGRRVMTEELRAKGVADELIDDALSPFDADAEEASARDLAASRLRQLSGLPPETQLRRLTGLLHRRGFPSRLAFRVAQEALGPTDAAE